MIPELGTGALLVALTLALYGAVVAVEHLVVPWAQRDDAIT